MDTQHDHDRDNEAGQQEDACCGNCSHGSDKQEQEECCGGGCCEKE